MLAHTYSCGSALHTACLHTCTHARTNARMCAPMRARVRVCQHGSHCGNLGPGVAGLLQCKRSNLCLFGPPCVAMDTVQSTKTPKPQCNHTQVLRPCTGEPPAWPRMGPCHGFWSFGVPYGRIPHGGPRGCLAGRNAHCGSDGGSQVRLRPLSRLPCAIGGRNCRSGSIAAPAGLLLAAFTCPAWGLASPSAPAWRVTLQLGRRWPQADP